MQTTHIINGTIILKDRLLRDSHVTVAGSKIRAVGKGRTGGKGSVTIDAKGCFVSPGFIDTHIHGEPKKILKNETRFGTTGFVIAESCGPLSKIYERIGKIRKFKKDNPLDGYILGIRLEGPYISSERAGAQDKRYIRQPDGEELAGIIRRYPGLLKIVTIAPEVDGAISLIKLLKKNGVVASLGHSDASYAEAIKGIEAGITHATHLFNAMRGSDNLNGGAAGACIHEKRVVVEVIADLVHVDRALLNILVKKKPLDSMILVTDSINSDDKHGAKLSGGAYRFKNGKLAGSHITLIEAVKNMVKIMGLSLPDAVRLASLNPARFCGVMDKKGSLESGKDADLVIFDKNFNVKMTMARGRIVHRP